MQPHFTLTCWQGRYGLRVTEQTIKSIDLDADFEGVVLCRIQILDGQFNMWEDSEECESSLAIGDFVKIFRVVDLVSLGKPSDNCVGFFKQDFSPLDLQLLH